MPNITYHVMYCHEGQRSKCKELKLRLSEVCEELQAAPGTALLDQESSRRLEVGTPSVSGGPRFLLPVFWCVTIIICSEVLNFNVTYTTLVLYCPTSLLCEVCEGLLTAVFQASLPRSERCVPGLQTGFARQDDGSSIYCHCAADPCFALGYTEFEVALISTGSSVHTCSYKKT